MLTVNKYGSMLKPKYATNRSEKILVVEVLINAILYSLYLTYDASMKNWSDQILQMKRPLNLQVF